MDVQGMGALAARVPKRKRKGPRIPRIWTARAVQTGSGVTTRRGKERRRKRTRRKRRVQMTVLGLQGLGARAQIARAKGKANDKDGSTK